MAGHWIGDKPWHQIDAKPPATMNLCEQVWNAGGYWHYVHHIINILRWKSRNIF